MEVLTKDYTETILRNNPAERLKGALSKIMSGLPRAYSSPDGALVYILGNFHISACRNFALGDKV